LDLSRLSDLNVINVEWGNACIDQQLSFIGNYFEQNITGLYDNARDCAAQSDDRAVFLRRDRRPIEHIAVCSQIAICTSPLRETSSAFRQSRASHNIGMNRLAIFELR
jgi:hypothetical protein